MKLILAKNGGDVMNNNEFENLLSQYKNVIERFAYCKLPSKVDADDILQDVYLIAYEKFHTLENKNSFKSWIIKILINKCNDFYRKKARNFEIPIDELTISVLSKNRYGLTEQNIVYDTLDKLNSKNKQILFLYYFKNKPQEEIAKILNIPIGTVKSRLHTAKKNFKENYPYSPILKGDFNMKQLPDIMPEYKITELDKKPFNVKWEELMGWFIVPKLGEKLSWAIYDFPEKFKTDCVDMKVIGKATIHGIDCVEIIATEYNPLKNIQNSQRSFFAQLTDTHCRLLAESHTDGDIKKFYTFLDEDDFIQNWGFGKDNCGRETHLSKMNIIKKVGTKVSCTTINECLDVVGRYSIEINNKIYDTICILDINSTIGIAYEQFIDQNGRTIIWRRFNRDDWELQHYGQKWTEKLPINKRISINNETYVHWYDCITNYIL